MRDPAGYRATLIEVDSPGRDERADLLRCRKDARRQSSAISAQGPTPWQITDELPAKSWPVSIEELGWSKITHISAASGSSAGIEVPGGPSSPTWILGVKRRAQAPMNSARSMTKPRKSNAK